MSEEQRLQYIKLAPKGMAAMRAVEHYVNTETNLEPSLLELVRLRASLMNGCEYCIALHMHEMEKWRETPNRIEKLADWREADVYTERERAALAWAEKITNIQAEHVPKSAYDEALQHFSEVELVNLTLAIASINAWNRMAIAFRAQRPGTQAETGPK